MGVSVETVKEQTISMEGEGRNYRVTLRDGAICDVESGVGYCYEDDNSALRLLNLAVESPDAFDELLKELRKATK